MASQPPAVTGDGYLQDLVRFVDANSASILDSTLILKVTPLRPPLRPLPPRDPGGDFRALEQLRRILRLVTEVRVVAVLRNSKGRNPTRACLGGVFGRLRSLELRGCDLSAAEAKGLLQLRGALERLVCYNSTVIEENSHTVSLSLENATSWSFNLETIVQSKISVPIKLSSGSLTLKLKSSSENGSSQFAKPLKALLAGTGCPLFIRCK